MAEIFGVVTGALSVAALFNNCVECFEHIQLAKSFGRDYQTCQLRLDAARLRVSRWGAAVDVQNNERFISAPAGDDREAKMAILYFEEIQHLIQGVQRTAKRYELANPSHDTSLASIEDMTSAGKVLHNRATAIARQRQKSTGVLKKIAWALYDGKEFERLISQIVSLVDELEEILPIEPTYRRMVDMEIEELDDAPTLALLQEAAHGTDRIMSEAVERKLLTIAGSNSAGAVATKDQADVQVGHRYSDQVMAQGLNMKDNTTNRVGDIDAQGTSKVQIGNRFGR